MNKNVALVLGLLPVLAFAGWRLLGGGEDAAPPPTGLTLEPEVAPEAKDAGAALADAGGPATAPVSTQREEAEAPAARAAAEAGDLVVRVVDEDDAPLADVEVLVLNSAGEDDVRAFHDLARVDALLEENGRTARSNADGALHLAPPAEDTSLLLVGRTEALWGKLRISHEQLSRPRPRTLVLRPDRTVLVQVVDEAGRPVAGQDVTVEEAHEQWSNEITRAETGDDGVATFAHLQFALATRYRSGEGRLVVQLDVLAPAPIREPLEAGDGGVPIVLVRPATGSVEVHVFTFEQQPFEGEVNVGLTHVPEGSPRVPSPFSNERRSSTDRTAKDGVARFEAVALGMELDAHASRPGVFVEAHAYGPGPVRAGDAVRLDVRFGVEQPILQLRLLDEDAAPLAETQLNVELRSTGGYLPGNTECYPTTDAQGFLRLDLTPDPSEDVERSLAITVRGDGESQPTAEVELPSELRNGLNDLGEVTLGQAPLFLSGVVRSTAGEPLANAVLSLEHRPENGRRGWQNVMRFNVRSGDDGRFEAHGSRPAGPYRIAARVRGYAARWVEFTPGARDVVLELTPEATIRGRLLVDEGVDVQGLRVRLSGGPPGEKLEYNQRMAKIADDGAFTFTGLHAGEGRTVHLQFDDVWKDLQTFEGVAAVVGEATQDPRLNPIDLRGQLYPHRLEVTGLGEGDALSGHVVYGPAGSGELAFERWLHERSVVLLSSTPRIDLVGNFDGFRQVELSSVGEAATIELQPALEVTLVLTGDVALPEPPLYLKPALAPADDENFDADVGGDALGESRRVSVHAPASGRLRVLWIAERRSESGSVAGEVRLERKQYIEVVDGLEGQTFEVDLTAEEMETIAGRFR